MPDDPDEEVLRRFTHGERDAFETLFRRFQVEVYRWIARIVRDPSAAEDLVVEAFWRAYRGRARFDPGRSFGAWMRQIATNVARDHLASAHRRARGLPIVGDVAAPPAPDRAVAESVALAFRRLPPKLRIVATLALVEERPYEEISAALAIPIGTVKSRAFRAIRALRKELARLGILP